MKKNTLWNSFPILLLAVIVVVPLFWITFHQPSRQISLVEARYLTNFPAPDYRSIKTGVKRILQRKPGEALTFILGQYLDRSYQKKFEGAASDQFPLRLPLIQTARALDRSMIELAYSPLPDPAIPAAMNSGIYIMRDGSRLIAGPNKFDENRLAYIDNHLENLNDLILDHPELNFYLFYLQRLVDSPFHPLNQFFPNADKGQQFAYFLANRPVGLTLSSLTFSTFKDLLDSYFKTDHHWNIFGIQKAYKEIYKMLKTNYPDLSPALDLSKVQTVPGIEFLGSYARETLYPIPREQFEIAQVNLPPLDQTIKGETKPYNMGPGGPRGDLPKAKFADIYSYLYEVSQELVEFDNKNGPTRNLLILGSSYARPLIPLIASHYKHTYYVDLREFTDFSFSKFVASHPVDDVLIVANDFMLYRDDWLIKP